MCWGFVVIQDSQVMLSQDQVANLTSSMLRWRRADLWSSWMAELRCLYFNEMKEETNEKLRRCLCDILKMAGQGDGLWAFEWIWLKALRKAARRSPKPSWGSPSWTATGVLKAWSGSETLVWIWDWGCQIHEQYFVIVIWKSTIVSTDFSWASWLLLSFLIFAFLLWIFNFPVWLCEPATLDSSWYFFHQTTLMAN